MGGTSKRRRRNDDYPKLRSSQQRKKHLYLALDDWNGGYSIHRLDDADDILDGDSGGGGEEELPEPAAIRIASRCDMSFAAVGSNIFIGTNRGRNCAPPPPTLVYDTKTAAISAGPLVPECIHDLGAAMAVGENLYAPTTVPFIMSTSLQVLSMEEPWDPNPTKEWSWNTVPSPSELPFNGIDIIAYAVHRDGRTIFISAGGCTYALDTSNGVCKELGEWLLPFRGQAFFDSGLDAWVGLHREHDGRVCCCPATSLSVTTTQQPAECRMLREKLLRRSDEDPKHWSGLRGKATSLTYMGDSRFALFENILRSGDLDDGCVIHVTLFALKYNHNNGELKTKARRATRSYAVSKHNRMFSHAAFWM